MNAADRLWRALAAGDWPAVGAQLAPNAVIERPGHRALAADDYVAHLRAAGAPDAVEVRRRTGDGTIVAFDAAVRRGEHRWRVLAIYDLHDARVAGGTEVWVAGA
ncbi:MAG: nuclear transport factor 2 family protein [Solirubrobacteraceae bacterium]